MQLERSDFQHIVDEIKIELHGNIDGTGKNIIVPECPFCGHTGGKFGIYIGKETDRKKQFMSHCFHCGKSTRDLKQLLTEINRMDLMPTETASFTDYIQDDFSFMDDKEIDDSLETIKLPESYKRTVSNSYLNKRGFTEDDYDFFQCGTTRYLNFKFDDYIIFPIIDNGNIVGYVSRIMIDKKDLEEQNREARLKGKYQKLRYKNSNENDFVKLLYNYDSVIEGETDTVILTEGIFDTIALTRKLNLYDNPRMVAVATFGKKISDIQMYKLQMKGVKTVIIGYDSDAKDTIKKVSMDLSEYFDTYIAWITSGGKDWDEMSYDDIYETFAYNIFTPVEFKLNVL